MYKQLEYEGEEDTFQIPYRLYDELPAEIANLPEGYNVVWDDETESFYQIESPDASPQLTPEQERIALLEDQVETLSEAIDFLVISSPTSGS
jgi:hypothetical protein